MDRFIEHLSDAWPLYAGAALIVLVIVGVGVSAQADAEAKAAFMAECEQYEKRYQCEAKWRAGEPDVVPVFIPIVTR